MQTAWRLKHVNDCSFDAASRLMRLRHASGAGGEKRLRGRSCGHGWNDGQMRAHGLYTELVIHIGLEKATNPARIFVDGGGGLISLPKSENGDEAFFEFGSEDGAACEPRNAIEGAADGGGEHGANACTLIGLGDELDAHGGATILHGTTFRARPQALAAFAHILEHALRCSATCY